MAYLDAWKAEDYSTMYGLLTSVSKDAIDEESFTKRYVQIANEAALGTQNGESEIIDYSILSSLINSPFSAQVGYQVSLHSILVGDINADTVMNLTLENGDWRVQWDDSLILPQLAGGNYLSMDYLVPSRANIYDRNKHALVAQEDAVAIGLDAGKVDIEQEDGLINLLNRITGLSQDVLSERINTYRNNNWYMPLTDMSVEALTPFEGALSSFAGIQFTPFRTRYYFDGGPVSIAPHVTGYMSAIQQEEVDYYKRLGYRQDERVGRSGLELWGEPYLAGKRGGALYVVSPDGKIVTKLAESSTLPSQSIDTTLDKTLQIGAQQAIAGFNGAVVAIELNTGRVLAMASSPGFDPNLYDTNNINWQWQLQDIYSNPDTPLLNRATQGQYPLGSVFKIITMSAALESGVYTPETEFNCTYFFTELQGVQLHDWTYDYFLKDGRTQASGPLTLPQGLMRSCNPFFWHIGLDLFRQGLTTQISNMARGFGLGSLTGIQGVDEASGLITDPISEVDATNLAIGQGKTLVTPLQVANFVAAVGNGGTLYQPSLIERIAPPDGEASYVFTPTVHGKLPISPENLKVVQDAMVSVVANRRGTAWHRFTGLQVNIAGKTGTAQAPAGEPHAWFAGYTFENNPDKPDIAVAVIIENIGEGSEFAAPVFRRIIEIYFFGRPLSTYPWEAAIGVARSPTPEETGTASPEETATSEP
jgi:penicillin-binding protein 2